MIPEIQKIKQTHKNNLNTYSQRINIRFMSYFITPNTIVYNDDAGLIRNSLFPGRGLQKKKPLKNTRNKMLSIYKIY